MKTFSISAMLCLLVLVILFSAGCKKEKDDDNPSAPTTVKDIDGNVYPVVKVGAQYWMGENLRTTRFRNGNVIPTTTPLNKNVANLPDSRYQWPQNYDESLAATWGRVYTAMAVTDIRGLCPQGWRVPSEDDFNELIKYLKDNRPSGYTSYPEMVLSPDPDHWEFLPNMIGTPKNITGFSLMAGGIRQSGQHDSISVWSAFQTSSFLSTSNMKSGNMVSYFHYHIGSPNIVSNAGGGETPAGHVRCVME